MNRKSANNFFTMPILKTITGKEVLFIHIPKTGGQTIEHLFGLDKLNFEHPETHKIFYGWNAERTLQPVHYTYNEILAINPEVKNMQVFAVVRNPYDKVVSEFLFAKRTGYDPLFGYNIKFISFSLYLQTIYNIWEKLISGNDFDITYNISESKKAFKSHINTQFIRCHYLPQSHYITPENIAELGANLTIIRFEDYANQLWNYLIHDCQPYVDKAYKIPVINSNYRVKENEKFYTLETWRIVSHLYQKDFELFNYAKY